ncbi:DNA excision repair protein ERCC-5 homolog [Ruditapes philippinarum]|uniref:DNA excision repair protein ERCC-5 homolog n=1 Tax=Ruditapes philippinarum TaxID=129788 RepID=UPI00295B345B|nr:DNA excision repair protein ERCC-5 homolog [Ruditapes philippinarum]
MGVHGLWQLLSSTGKPVPLESLEGKVLAVDVSVWLHQLSKGMRDSSGNPLPNAHLHGLFTRICKLLYYRIKPVFVFDGGVPMLKKQTLASRRNKREDAEKTSSLMQQKILTNLIRSQALKEACGLDKLPNLPPPPKSSAKGNKDVLYQLPPVPDTSVPYMSQRSEEDKTYIQRRELQEMVEDQYEDISKIDVESEDFKALPPDVQHEIMTDMRLRKKNYNLSKIVDLPDDSKDFSKYQMAKLLKHNKVNTRLEEVRKEMNTRQTRSLTKNFKGRFQDSDDIYSQRVVSEDSAHYILAKRNLSQKKEDKSRKMMEVEAETVTDKLEVIAEVDELIVDSDDDSAGEVDILEESRLIFEELSGKTDEPDSNTENKRNISGKTNEPNDNIEDTRNKTMKHVGVNRIEKQEKDKPRFRAVIEVESDSGTDTSDDSVKVVGDETVVLDDSNVDPELQFAIELSLQEQRHTNVSKVKKLRVQDTELYKKTENVDAVSTKNKHSNRSGIPVVTAGRQTRQRSTEKRQQGIIEAEKSTKHQNKQSKVENLIGSSVADSDDINKEGRMCSSESNGRGFNDSKKENKVNERNNGKSSVDEQSNKETYTSRRTVTIEKKSGILKRNISCLSNESDGSGEEPNKVRKIDLSDVDTDADVSESSESDGDFIEVKVDLTKVREDNLFPASMFEAVEVIEPESMDSKDNIIQINDSAAEDNDLAVVEKEKGSTIGEVNDKINDQITVVDSDTGDMENETDNDESKNRTEINVDENLEVRSTGSDVMKADDDVTMVSEADDISLDSTEVPLSMKDVKERPSSPLVPNLVRQFESLNEQSVRGMRENLASENRQLRLEQGRQERLAVSITDQMHSEAQELLQLFGIPYIVSPTEAEAQCAQLELIKLTNGTITDDSDIWLFGGKCVFKNFFNQQKHVECFKDVTISSQLGLTRESLINIAMLCGSDYTEGIRGVGPVTAMEILAKFQGKGLESLQKLKSWWEDAQKDVRISVTTSKLLTKLRELDISEGFPNTQVVEAYLSPVVDDSTEKFTWSLPNLEQLRQYPLYKLKWNREKTDEVLLPVIKRLSEKQSQRSISAFFQPEVYMNPAPVKSKRLQKVVNKFVNPSEEQGDSDNEQDKKKTRSKGQGEGKKSRSKGQSGENETVDPEGMPESAGVGKEPVKGRGKASNKKTKEASQSKDKSAEQEKSKPDSEFVSDKEIDRKGKVACNAEPDLETKVRGKPARGRGKGRGRGRGQGQSLRSGNTKIEKGKIISSDSDSVDSESDSSTSSSDDDYDDSSDHDSNDDEKNVVQTGLNIDEILNLKMGCTFDEMKRVKKYKQKGKVVENVMNVNEILHLESGADGESKEVDECLVKEEEEEDVTENVDGDKVDTEKIDEEKFKNEGGFIREDDFEMEECPELESEDFMMHLKTLEDKCAIDNESAKIQDKPKDLQKNVPEESEKKKKKSKMVENTTATEDSCKIETKRTRSSRTNSKRDKSKVLQSVTQEDAEPVEDEDDNIKDDGKFGGSVESEVLNTSDKINVRVEDKTSIESVKIEVSEIDETNVETASWKSGKNETETTVKPIKPVKTETKSKKAKPDSIYKTDPIKPVVTGLPWAEKRRGQRRGQSARGQGKLRLHTIAPVETVKKKSKPAEKKRFDCVNLSESDSDD